MKIFDPLAPFNGTFLHRLDLDIAEAITTVPHKSLSSHAAEPLVHAGATRHNAVAVVHWMGIAVLVALVAFFRFSRSPLA